MSICKAETCRRPIVWATTRNGKSIPLDADPDRRVILEPEVGCPAKVGELCTCPGAGHVKLARIVDVYTPHHATCRAVGRFRRPA